MQSNRPDIAERANGAATDEESASQSHRDTSSGTSSTDDAVTIPSARSRESRPVVTTGLDRFLLLELYRNLLLPRMIEEKMLLLLRQGKISKWFSGIGQEAIAVGATMALEERDWVLPLHRNLGVFTTRDVPLERLFAQWQGKKSGYTKGRDRSFHFGAPEHRIVGMISHLGSMLGVADGLALAGKLRGEETIALAFSGDGGTSQGDFHEAINLASCWDLPVIFLVENNGYALSTPTSEQFRCEQLADRAAGYGIEGRTIDGNNVLEVFHSVRSAAAEVRRTGRPILIEAMTFRRRGHEEASGVAYVPKAEIARWESRDPIARFERQMSAARLLDSATIDRIRTAQSEKIDRALAEAFADDEPTPDAAAETADVYTPDTVAWSSAPEPVGPEARFVDAIAQGLRQGMKQEPKLVVMGQDVAGYGGVFKVTDGLLDEFGPERVRNTPLCEAAVLGAALGLAIDRTPSVVEMQFADFVSEGFNQIVNNIAKTRYRWGTPVNVTVRMPTGGSVGAGPFHSQSNEAWFAQVPGLKIAFPSTPYDAKGLLLTALRDRNPVMFFEHKYLYRSAKGPLPTDYYTLPFGKARTVRAGSGLTIVTWGIGRLWAEKLAADHPEWDPEVIDLRTLVPWDKEAVIASVRRTGRCVVLHEATRTAGFGAEIVAEIAEACFASLDAPVARAASLDTPVPFHPRLESEFQADRRLEEVVRKAMAY